MNSTILSILSVLVMLGVLASLANSALRHRLANLWHGINNTIALANDGGLTVGEHQGGRITGYHDSAPVTTRFLLVKQGSADNKYATITSIADIPLAVCTDEPAATTDPVNFQMLNGCDKTQRMVASGAIAAGALVVTNGDGKVKTLPAVAGVYWNVGYAVTTAADGDLVEVAPSLQQVGVSFVT